MLLLSPALVYSPVASALRMADESPTCEDTQKGFDIEFAPLMVAPTQ